MLQVWESEKNDWNICGIIESPSSTLRKWKIQTRAACPTWKVCTREARVPRRLTPPWGHLLRKAALASALTQQKIWSVEIRTNTRLYESRPWCVLVFHLNCAASPVPVGAINTARNPLNMQKMTFERTQMAATKKIRRYPTMTCRMRSWNSARIRNYIHVFEPLRLYGVNVF